MGCGRSKERHLPPFPSEQDLTEFSFGPSQFSTLSQQEINTPAQGQGRAATSTPPQPLINPYVLQLASRPAHEQEPTNTSIRRQRLDARNTQIPVGTPSEEQRWGVHPARLRQRADDADLLRRISLQSERSSLPGIRTSISSERSSPSSVRGASPVGERTPLSIRARSAIDEPEQPSTRPSNPQSWLTSPPTGRDSPFASPQVQELYLSSSSSASSSSSQQRQKAAGSSQSQPGGASPPPPPSSSPHLNRSESNPLRTHCKKGCRCMTCRPQFYTPDGELTRVWSSPCLKQGCRCPICTEICLSDGHMLPKCQQCRRRGCLCRTGCMDINCPICRTAMAMDRGSRPLSRLNSRPSMPRINSGSSLARTSGSDE